MSVAANKLIVERQGDVEALVGIPAAAKHLYQGTLAFLDISGYATDVVAAGANPFAGIVNGECDNLAGAAGDLTVQVRERGKFELPGSSFTQADVGKDVYATDNYTLTLAPDGGSYVGRVSEYVSSSLLIVRFDLSKADRRKVNLAAATQTLTLRQSGEKFVGAVDAVFTLPAAAAATKGVYYEFETGALSTGTGLSISPNAADHIRGNGLTSTDNKDLINTGATDRLGDSVRIYCDGVDGWVIDAIIGTWAKEA